MKFLAPRAWDEITKAAKACNGPSYAAVAYFGNGGETLLPLPQGSVLVVDATIETVAKGVTSPAALRQVLKRGVSIYSVRQLHAKLFVFGKTVFVGSANASKNSANNLIETVVRVDSAPLAKKARSFIESLAVTELTDADLASLEKHYKPPQFGKAPTLPKKQSATSTLLMELTFEQGPGRETQVQPPRPVWEAYFGVNFDHGPYPTLRLINRAVQPPTPLPRKVVAHDHNLTIEITGAEMPRPAILEIRRVGRNTYSYLVHRPPSQFFKQHQQTLNSTKNPLWSGGRKWLIL